MGTVIQDDIKDRFPRDQWMLIYVMANLVITKSAPAIAELLAEDLVRGVMTLTFQGTIIERMIYNLERFL
jgi:hypothetical protein